MDADLLICPACAHANPAGSRFCNACGTSLATIPSPEALPPAKPLPAIGPTIQHSPSGQEPGRDADLQTGALIGPGGRYVVERAIGRGGFGQAYLVFDSQLGRYCVAKRQMVNPAWGERTREMVRQNFRREAQLLGTLNTPGHPNIPEIFEYLPDISCLVMKYVEGHDLTYLLKQRGGRLPQSEALTIARSVCSALAYMHSHAPEPVLHRDIKPSNILIDSASRVWVIDFGLSKATSIQLGTSNTQQSQISGTFGFAPPEQWRGRAEARSDVYALCATLHMLLTGYHPSLDRADLHDFLQGTVGAFPLPRSIEPSISAEVETLIMRGLSFDPASRPTSTQLLAALEYLLAPSARSDLQAPDGTFISDEISLARWAEEHWDLATTWLYSNLSEQVEQLWGKNRLAGDIRGIISRHASELHAGLDALLVILDPKDFAAAKPRLIADKHEVHFGSLALTQRSERIVHLNNAGRRYIRVDVQTPRWIIPSPLRIMLPPGRQFQLKLTADMRRSNESGRMTSVVSLRDYSGANFRIDVSAQLSRWQAFRAQLFGIGGKLNLDWESGEIETLRVIQAHRAAVWGVDLHPDGQQIASGGWDQRVRLWRVSDGEPEQTFAEHEGNLLAVAYSPDGQLLAGAGNSAQIVIWHVPSGRLMRRLSGQHDYQENLHFSPDGQLIMANGGDQTVRIWRVSDGSLIQQVSPGAGILTMACHPDGQTMALCCTDRSIRIWNIAESRLQSHLNNLGTGVNCLTYSRDGGLLVAGGAEGLLWVWDFELGGLRYQLRGHQNTVRSVAVHPDGQIIASGSVDGSIRLWRVSDGSLIQVLNGHSSGVLRIVFSASGHLLASGGGDGLITLWQPTS